MGYNVEIVVSDAITQHPAVASGNINLSTEVWTNNVGDLYDGLVDKGDIVVVVLMLLLRFLARHC